MKMCKMCIRDRLDVVLLKGAVVGGGVDVTDDLINKMGKASDEDIKAAENEANQQEAQQAQQGEAQQAQPAEACLLDTSLHQWLAL